MACYTVNMVSVEFKAKYINILRDAAKLLQWSFNERGDNVVSVNGMLIDLTSEQARIADYRQDDLNKLKRTYSIAAVKELAKKKKWVAKVKGVNKIQLRRY